MATVSDFRFLTDLHLVRFRNGSGCLFVLQREYRVGFTLDGLREIYTVPAGMETDLASIPDVIPKWIAKKVDSHIEAAIVHDKMCIDRGPWSSEIAADIFKAAMLAAGVPSWRAGIMYTAVRNFGPQWGEKTDTWPQDDDAGE